MNVIIQKKWNLNKSLNLGNIYFTLKNLLEIIEKLALPKIP